MEHWNLNRDSLVKEEIMLLFAFLIVGKEADAENK